MEEWARAIAPGPVRRAGPGDRPTPPGDREVTVGGVEAVKDFGPLWVGIDSHGNSMFHDVQEQATKKLEELYDRL